MNKILAVVKGIIVGIVIWYAVQIPIGFVIGLVYRVTNGTYENAMTTCIIFGIIGSLIAETIYIIHMVKNRD